MTSASKPQPSESASERPAWWPERSIVCFACEDYWYHPVRSRRHLMERLARRGWRVLFVNSIGMRAPSRSHPDFWRRVRRKLGSLARWVRRPDPQGMPTFWVASPAALPFFGSPAARALNRVALRWQIRLAMARAGVRRPVAWFGLPTMADLRGRIGERLDVLHNSDKYEAYREIDGDHVARCVERLLAECDIAVSASATLAKECAESNPNSFHLPHGVDGERFSRARLDPDLTIPDDLAAIPRPRIGYMGSVDQVLDHGLIAHIAQKRPDWHQVFVGLYSDEVAGLRERLAGRVHFLGQRPYEQVPAYLRGLDAAYMPLLDDQWARYANHLKLKEYFLAARPTAVIPHAETDAIADNPLLHVGGPDPEDFLRALDEALAQSRGLLDPATGLPRPDNADLLAAEPLLQEIALGTWDARADQLEEWFAKFARE
jgi:glycosyltransferase involved in cell wall biosynthesis